MESGDHGLKPDSSPTPAPIPAPGPTPAPRGMMLGAVVVLSGFVLSQGPTLYDEVNCLMLERDGSRLSSPIGFIDITPNPTYATPPKNWAHVEGDSLLLWSGWDTKLHQHSWFRVGKSDLDVRALHLPMGRDVIRAIDQTRLESREDPIWNRMRYDMLVLPIRVEREGVSSHYAYPLMLLERVQAVNDTLAGSPLLVLFTPFVPLEEAMDLFVPVVDGQRVRLASSGHHIEPGRRPLMYDTSRQDLWVREPQGMVCLSGERKGAVLKRLPLPEIATWEDWSDDHPDGHLIVGASRSQPKPPRRRAVVSGTSDLARAGGPAAP